MLSISEISEITRSGNLNQENTLSQEDSRVRTFLSLAVELDLKKGPGQVFGLRCGPLLSDYDPDLQLWRTLERSLFEDLPMFWHRLPKSGMMRNGRIYEQRTWVLRTGGKGSGLWPTPRAVEGSKMSQTFGNGDLTLTGAVKKWPTPKTPTGGGQVERKTPGGGIRKLEDAISAEVGYNTGQLNPTWVAWLMGYPIDWLNENKHGETTGAESNQSQEVRRMRSGGQDTETPRRSIEAIGSQDSMSEMPHEAPYQNGHVGKGEEEAADMHGMRDGFRSAGLAPAQNLQPSLSDDPRTRKRYEAVAWETEPDVGRLATGVPNRVNKLRGLGNAIVPQIAELLWRQIKSQI